MIRPRIELSLKPCARSARKASSKFGTGTFETNCCPGELASARAWQEPQVPNFCLPLAIWAAVGSWDAMLPQAARPRAAPPAPSRASQRSGGRDATTLDEVDEDEEEDPH